MIGRLLYIPDGPASLAYSLPLLAALRQAGATIKVAPTSYDGPSAAELITPLGWSTISGHPCLEIECLDKAAIQWAEVVVLAPATPLLERVFRDGRGNALLADAARPILVLLSRLASDNQADRQAVAEATEASAKAWLGRLPKGSRVLSPTENSLSLGAMGGINAPAITDVLETAERMTTTAELSGKRVLVSAGPTVEDIDPVRFISNRSSGKMGLALALAAWRQGAQVTLVHGPITLDMPHLEGLELLPVRSAAQMHDAMASRWNDADVAIFSAAVADFTPDHYCPEKIKKVDGQSMLLHLLRTKDILGELGTSSKRPRCLVGFAAESDDVEINALAKLRRKRCTLLCANDIRKPGSGFAVDTNAVTIYGDDGSVVEIPTMAKRQVAERIIKEVVKRLGTPTKA